MKQFLTRIAGFGVFFLIVSAALLLVDLYVYDTNANAVMNGNEKLENKVVVIGSSKINHGLIKDSLDRYFPNEVYAAGGQYNLESLNFLFNKQRKGEIGKGNTIFLNLEAGDALLVSYRKFNWFAENFTIYGFYPWSAFPADKYPKILSRVYVDILDLQRNRVEPFKWEGLGLKGEKADSHVDLDAYRKYCNNTPGKLTNDSMYAETMQITANKLAQLEKETGSRVFMLIPPGSHMVNNALVIRQHFPKDHVIDLTCIEGLDDSTCWFDGNHLSPKGAKIFTSRFIEVAQSCLQKP